MKTMNWIGKPPFIAAVTLAALWMLGGCADTEPDGEPVAVVPESRVVVEEYLEAASRADGAAMYALIATSERDEETPESLADTARDRYTAGASWEFLQVEEQESTSEVVTEINGAQVDPNPYRFTLTRESGEWRIVQSPELHETEKDGIEIKL